MRISGYLGTGWLGSLNNDTGTVPDKNASKHTLPAAIYLFSPSYLHLSPPRLSSNLETKLN